MSREKFHSEDRIRSYATLVIHSRHSEHYITNEIGDCPSDSGSRDTDDSDYLKWFWSIDTSRFDGMKAESHFAELLNEHRYPKLHHYAKANPEDRILFFYLCDAVYWNTPIVLRPETLEKIASLRAWLYVDIYK